MVVKPFWTIDNKVRMTKVVCNTKFTLNPFGDGGSRRSVQIRELLADNGLMYDDEQFQLPKDATNTQLVKWALRAMSFIRKYYPEKIGSIGDYVRLIRYYALRIPIVFDKYRGKDVIFLWENTNDRNMLYLMKATGCRVVGLPHNLESLVNKNSIKALDSEIRNLGCCDAVFTISKEETWLLRLFGLNAFYLPYYSPREVETYLISVRHRREKRSPNVRKKFLLLGSATNKPTRVGLQLLIDYAETSTFSFDMQVAGYGTASLRKANHPNIEFYGAVPNDRLEQLLLETDAVLIYQPPTTGALTRIPEMLTAGIPVFVNFDAARDCHNIEDVRLYGSFEELFGMLESFEPFQTEKPTRDLHSERRFVELMKR
jgi:hypothetical protein